MSIYTNDSCACRVEVEVCDDGTFYPIIYCPIHAAAPALFEAYQVINARSMALCGEIETLFAGILADEERGLEVGMSKPSPGPWAINAPYIENEQARLAYIYGAAYPLLLGGACVANAQLIAAAPDLLAACEQALAGLAEISVSKGLFITGLQGQLRDAIAKAKGENNADTIE